MIALDGGSGAGKSTIAGMLESRLDIAIVPLDDFFSGNIPDPKWDVFTVEEKLRYVIDWDRVRADAIRPLLHGRPAHWRAFDFQAGLTADGTYGMEKETRQRKSARMILIEGAYSSSPALADLVDLTILVDVPLEERRARLGTREEAGFLEQWHKRWDEVETFYFGTIRPRDSFDLVIKME